MKRLLWHPELRMAGRMPTAPKRMPFACRALATGRAWIHASKFPPPPAARRRLAANARFEGKVAPADYLPALATVLRSAAECLFDTACLTMMSIGVTALPK